MKIKNRGICHKAATPVFFCFFGAVGKQNVAMPKALPLSVVGGIDRVEVFAVHSVLCNAQSIAEALVVHKLTLAQIFDGVAHVGIVHKTKDVVIGHTRFLLCYYHVFATFLGCQKMRKILIFQGFSALLKLTIFQKFQ